LFSQSLNDVLKDLAFKLIEQVKVDTVNALLANMEAMNTAVQENLSIMDKAVKNHIKAINTAHKNMDTANTKVINYDKHLKILLDNRLKATKESVYRLFDVDGFRKFMFWAGILCSIFTPIVLVVIFLL